MAPPALPRNIPIGTVLVVGVDDGVHSFYQVTTKNNKVRRMQYRGKRGCSLPQVPIKGMFYGETDLPTRWNAKRGCRTLNGESLELYNENEDYTNWGFTL